MSATGNRQSQRCGPYRAPTPGVRSARDEHGFTLIELLAALAIMALITGIGFPALQNQVTITQQVAARNEVLFALAQARGDALGTATPVRLAVNDDGALVATSKSFGSRPSSKSRTAAAESVAPLARRRASVAFSAPSTAARTARAAAVVTHGDWHDQLRKRAATWSPS